MSTHSNLSSSFLPRQGLDMSSMSTAAFFTLMLGMVGVAAFCWYLSQPRTTEDNQQEQDSKSQPTYRAILDGIPSEDNLQSESHVKQQTETLVRKAFNVEDKVQIRIRSIATDPFSNKWVGTLNFSTTPAGIAQSTINLELDLGFVGLTPLYSGRFERESLDIIALPGLGGHAIRSFKAENEDYIWLRDQLPLDMPSSCIYTCVYSTKVPGSKSFQSLEDLGLKFRRLLEKMVNHNEEKGHRKRIVLIGHSLGGLIIKEAVCQLFRAENTSVLELLRGILFFGTPTQGMDNSQLVSMAEGQPNEGLIRSLARDSTELRRGASSWDDVFEKSPKVLFKNLKIFSYYETLQTPTYVKKGAEWKKEGKDAILVERNSATHGRPWERRNSFVIPIDRNHSDLVKFGRNDHVYLTHVKPDLKDLLKMDQKQGLFRLNESEEACLESIQFSERNARFDEIVEAVDGTCTWLFDDPEYEKWFRQQRGLLRLKGYRTSGKSTLMKRAVKMMKFHPEVVVMSHFFWQAGARIRENELLRNACGFFRSLLYQFLPHSYSSLEIVMSKYKEMRDNPLWGPQWMKELLEKEIPQACRNLPIVILVDAIDECSPEDRIGIMNFLRKLSKSPEGSLRICVSYSPGLVTEEADIDVALCNYKDIASYVQDKLSALPETKLSVSTESERSIPMEIQGRAQGMFLWAEIACDKVIQMDWHGESAQFILQAIESLPKMLDDMFLELLKSMDPKDAEESLKLFRWICFARWPLSVADLQYAIMMDPDMKETSIKEVRKNSKFREEQRDVIRAIFHLSMGLVKIVDRANSSSEILQHEPVFSEDSNTGAEPSQGWEGEVLLIHDCVLEFLLSRGFGELKGAIEGSFSNYGIQDAISSGHFYLSRSCIRYLGMEERHVWTSEVQKQSLLSVPLLEYTTNSWLFHTEQVERAKKSQGDVLKLLQWPSTDIFTAWVKLYNIFSQSNRSTRWIRDFTPDVPFLITYLGRKPSLLHILARHGLVSLLGEILSSSNIEGNEINSICRAARPSAADEDQYRAVKSSFEVNKVNADEPDDFGRTPLWYAVVAEQMAAVNLLLKSNYVNPNKTDFVGYSPLRLAVSRGSGDIMAAFFKNAEKSVQLTVGLLIDVGSNWRHWAEVLKIFLNERLPEVKVTEEMVDAAARKDESQLEVIGILILEERVEIGDTERTLERILELFDMNTTRRFLEKRCSGMEVSENMLVAAAQNGRSGAELIKYLLVSDSTILITNRMMKSAATNREQGPEVMKVFLRSRRSIETITTQVLLLATNYWRNGEEVMRMLLRDERTEEISRAVMDAALSNYWGGQFIKAFFMERRLEVLMHLRAMARADWVLIRVADFETSGAEVMELLLEEQRIPIEITALVISRVTYNRHGADMMRVLLRKRNTEVLRLLTKEMIKQARIWWGSDVAQEVFKGSLER